MAGGGVVLVLSALVARNGWLMNRSWCEPLDTPSDPSGFIYSYIEDMQSQPCLELHLCVSEQDDRNGYVSKCGLRVGKTTLIEDRGRGKRGVHHRPCRSPPLIRARVTFFNFTSLSRARLQRSSLPILCCPLRWHG